MTSPAGTPYRGELSVADDVFLLVHTDDGRLRVHPDSAGLLLAAGLLTELVIAECVSLTEGDDRVLVNRYARTPDAATLAVVESILRELQPLPLRTWLDYFAKTAYDDVSRRLLRAGLIERTDRWLRAPLYPPYDPEWVNWKMVRIGATLRDWSGTDLTTRIVAALLAAAGLDRQLAWDIGSRQLRINVDLLTCSLPAPIPRMIQHTAAANAANAIQRHRA